MPAFLCPRWVPQQERADSQEVPEPAVFSAGHISEAPSAATRSFKLSLYFDFPAKISHFLNLRKIRVLKPPISYTVSHLSVSLRVQPLATSSPDLMSLLQYPEVQCVLSLYLGKKDVV